MMLKRLSISLTIVLIVTSCYQYNKPEKPKDLISKEQMVNILIDIKLLTSANGKNKKVLEDHTVYPESYIYKKYNIDSLRFANSNNYYAYYTEQYNEIYTRIKDSMVSLQNALKELDKKEEEERKKETQRRKDSLDAIKSKDSLFPLKRAQDSIKALAKLKDSISEKNIEKGLIKPISDTDIQQ